ncbi:MAG: hypothetical protein OEM28_08355 [Nitrosopumilus sp.]|nr:hypothetical protein [Nitrosopumilus sp.]MDH3487860.1 hypothetical protein [Nitrosopumilus sp.]
MFKKENYIVEQCPGNSKKQDIYITDEEGIDRLVYCGNRGS